ncbi:MAG: hypothetical protein ABJB76_09910 [Candidatus Nitrosocosmicus sp.]
MQYDNGIYYSKSYITPTNYLTSSNTGQWTCLDTPFAMLPNTNFSRPVIPLVPMAIKSIKLLEA